MTNAADESGQQAGPDTSNTDRWGIDPTYLDADDQPHTVSPETIEHLRELIGDPDQAAGTAPIVGRPDQLGHLRGEVILETGETVQLADSGGWELGFGYHWLANEDGRRRLIVSPGRCHGAGHRAWVLAAQLYSTRSASSWGMGDLADLAELGRRSAALGAGYLLTNPLHAVAPTAPQQSSPYFPSTRRFANPIYLSVPKITGAQVCSGLDASPTETGTLIERDAVWKAKRRALQTVFDDAAVHGSPEPAFERWRAQAGPALEDYGRYCALAEHHGSSWRQWPIELQRPDSAAVARLAREKAADITFYCWLQWLLSVQLAEAAGTIGIIQDLPVGFDPDGLDSWVWQDLLAGGATIGAPPDQFNTAGQDWGLPPFVPWRLREANYQPFIDSIRASVLQGGGLRIDHVMGLFRLWWVPRGASAVDGGYVRYPFEDLLNIVALESHRARALVVGEDLGTVEDGVREAMSASGMLSYRVLWFEDEEPAHWARTSMAAVSTHDLPTVAGLWSGQDLEDQRVAGVDADPASTENLKTKLAREANLSADAPLDEAVRSAYQLLGQAPAQLLALTLEDAVGAVHRPNIPGTLAATNWSRPLPEGLEQAFDQPLLLEIAQQLSTSVAANQDRATRD